MQQQPDTSSPNPFVQGMQSYASGQYGQSAASNFAGMLLSMTGNSAAPSPQEQVIAQGMNDLAGETEKAGGNTAQAMVNYVRTPQAQKLMAIPGAFPKLIERFQSSLKQPEPTTAQIGQGNTGVIRQGTYPPIQQQQYPGTAGPGSTFYGSQGPTGQTTPTAEIQTFKGFADMFAGLSGSEGLLKQMAALHAAGPDAVAQRMVLANNMKNLGAPSQAAEAFANGLWSVQEDKNIPGRFYVSTVLDPGHIQMVQLGPQAKKSLVPTYGTEAAPPESFSSTPMGQQKPPIQGGTIPAPTNMPNMPGATVPVQPQGNAAPPTPGNQQFAAKYNAPVEAVKPNGMIDPVAAYGPSSIFALGGGLPAMVQNAAGVVSRWFDPSQSNAASETISKAEIGLQSLQYLQTGLAEGSRVRKMVDAALEMGPEHEKWNDPQYATMQFIQLRQTLEGEARTNSDNVTNLLQSGIKADNSMISDMSRKNLAIQNVLNFLPSTPALQGMLKAIRDGKIENVPSFATATSTVGQVAKTAMGHGLGIVFNSGTVQGINADPQGSIAKINGMGAAELSKSKKIFGQLDPVIQRAIEDRWNQLRGPGAQRYAPGGGGRSQGPSVQQFTQNPTGDQPPPPGPGRKPMSLPPGRGPLPADEPMPKLPRPPGQGGIYSQNPDNPSLPQNRQSRYDNAFAAFGR